MKNPKNTLVAAALLLLSIPAAYANEGADPYPNGAESWQIGSMPPAGLYFIDYSIYYSGQLKNGSGENVRLGTGTPTVNAAADALRAIWVTRRKVLSADIGAYLILAAVDQSVNMNGRRAMAGIGDAVFSPFALGWHKKNWSWTAALEFDAPLAHFAKNDPRVCLGTNYWSYQPHSGITFLSPSGWEVAAKFMYQFNATNGDTQYKSGQNLHGDYVAGKHRGRWSLGAGGYFLKQVTDDTLNGATVPAVAGLYDAGRRGQVLALGPTVKYETKSHIGFSAQWDRETLVRNRFGGEKLVFRLIVPASWGRVPRT